MPYYELLMICAPRATKRELLTTFRKVGKEIVDRGGIIRGFHNYGVRHLGQRMRRHGMVCNEGRYISMKTDCSAEASQIVNMICKDELTVLRWEMFKQKAPKVKQLRPQDMKHLIDCQKPVIQDPVFNFPKKDEMRRLRYNAKRKALDHNEQENLY